MGKVLARFWRCASACDALPHPLLPYTKEGGPKTFLQQHCHLVCPAPPLLLIKTKHCLASWYCQLRGASHDEAVQMSSTVFRRLALSQLRNTKTKGSGPPGGFFGEGRNNPGGNLFNESPLPPGQKRKWESWEAPWYVAGCSHRWARVCANLS